MTRLFPNAHSGSLWYDRAGAFRPMRAKPRWRSTNESSELCSFMIPFQLSPDNYRKIQTQSRSQWEIWKFHYRA